MCRGAGKMLRKTSKLDRQMLDGPQRPHGVCPPITTSTGRIAALTLSTPIRPNIAATRLSVEESSHGLPASAGKPFQTPDRSRDGSTLPRVWPLLAGEALAPQPR